MSKLTELVEWMESQDYRGNNPLGSAIKKARSLLAEEQSQKPTREELLCQLEAWQNIFGTTQLSHASARLDAAESEVKRLKWEQAQKPPAPAGLVEELADLEHLQWMDWALNIMSREELSNERKARWEKLIVPYYCLTESMKEQDRIWARKVIEILSRYTPVPAKEESNPRHECVVDGISEMMCGPEPAEVEPLAVLADRKGLRINKIDGPYYTGTYWAISIYKGYNELMRSITEDTYSAAEAKARAWLEKQPDVNKENV